ncbi:hypothetical protein PIB30_038347 [Stylosanthes scabra]|uniref:Uncharacterized protein n=1 Tax=Stylosanthes scabra TaxID=79078 RepID=A0ABU6YCS7_9FABA|nr:hypothetical protein [Stylosanthes scabra]
MNKNKPQIPASKHKPYTQILTHINSSSMWLTESKRFFTSLCSFVVFKVGFVLFFHDFFYELSSIFSLSNLKFIPISSVHIKYSNLIRSTLILSNQPMCIPISST